MASTQPNELRRWKCSACGFTVAFHVDDVQPADEHKIYCPETGQAEPVVLDEEASTHV